jgi:hypothetical protein
VRCQSEVGAKVREEGAGKLNVSKMTAALLLT